MENPSNVCTIPHWLFSKATFTCWLIHSFLTKNNFWALFYASCSTGDMLWCFRAKKTHDDQVCRLCFRMGYTTIPVPRGVSADLELLLCFSPCGQKRQGHKWLREAEPYTGSDNMDPGLRLTGVPRTLSVTSWVTLNNLQNLSSPN